MLGLLMSVLFDLPPPISEGELERLREQETNMEKRRSKQIVVTVGELEDLLTDVEVVHSASRNIHNAQSAIASYANRVISQIRKYSNRPAYNETPESDVSEQTSGCGCAGCDTNW